MTGRVIGALDRCQHEGCTRTIRDDGSGLATVCREHEGTFRCFTCGLDFPEPPYPNQTCEDCWEFELAGVRGNEGDEGKGCAAYLVALHNKNSNEGGS